MGISALMTNKPQNVVRHEHFFVHTQEEIDADPSLEIKRYDACQLANGAFGVWGVKSDFWLECESWEEATHVANEVAQWARDHWD
jgi:hypothetical protein